MTTKSISFNHYGRHRIGITIGPEGDPYFRVIKTGNTVPYGGLKKPSLLSIDHLWVLYHLREKVFIVCYMSKKKNGNVYFMPKPHKDNPCFVNLQRVASFLKEDQQLGAFSDKYVAFNDGKETIKVPHHFPEEYIKKMMKAYEKIRNKAIDGLRPKTKKKKDQAVKKKESDSETESDSSESLSDEEPRPKRKRYIDEESLEEEEEEQNDKKRQKKSIVEWQEIYSSGLLNRIYVTMEEFEELNNIFLNEVLEHLK